MTSIPKDKNPESTLSLLSNGYTFIQKKCVETNSDIFQTRLLFQNSICMRGKEGAELFYDNSRFERKKAMPKRLKKTLVGQGSIQGTDDEEHRHRKKMFMEVMSPENISKLTRLIERYWKEYIDKWGKMKVVVLFEEVQELLCHAVCEWIGLPLNNDEAQKRAQQLGAMIDGSGAVGIRHLKGRIGRTKTEKWLMEVIEEVRDSRRPIEKGSVIDHLIFYKNRTGEYYDTKITAVEILNIIRPTVALARYVVFEAMALHAYPQHVEKVKHDEDFKTWFVHEVRRFYPFFPMTVARTRVDFDWNGYHFPKGWKVFLDLYGTNRHPDLWEKPDEFIPERFENWDGNAFTLIPQGGGDHYKNHRCAGEWITIEVMKAALQLLTKRMEYDVPQQDLSIDLSRIPAIPKSRFIITNVRSI